MIAKVKKIECTDTDGIPTGTFYPSGNISFYVTDEDNHITLTSISSTKEELIDGKLVINKDEEDYPSGDICPKCNNDEVVIYVEVEKSNDDYLIKNVKSINCSLCHTLFWMEVGD